MKEFSLDFEDLEINALIPENKVKTIAYILEPDKVLYGLSEFIERNEDLGIVTIFGMDWDDDLSPWHEVKVFKKGRDFGGKADQFREKLMERVIPMIEKKMCVKPEQRFLIGISLAGLFALHTSYFTTKFDGIGAVSGSLWFKGFIDWMKNQKTYAKMVYISVGQQEKNTKNPIIATIEDCDKKAVEILKRDGVETEFEINPGGHFDDGLIRIEKALRWLISE